jgi:hypothetical protein
VRKCADCYLSLLLSRPELLRNPTESKRVLAWPGLGVRLVMMEGTGPDMIWEREYFALAEAITYYEFTLEQLILMTGED